MGYKAFQDWYHEANIRHLLLYVYKDKLISPPFATENCKEYSKILVWDGDINYIDLDLPPATSKTNAVIEVGGDLWLIPYGIYDKFNVVVQLKDFAPVYHYIDKPGKGQFYSAATSGNSGFSFPLGYEDTSFGIYINSGKVSTVDFNKNGKTKLHMGCVYAAGRFWSMPRSDDPGYIDLVSFDGQQLRSYPLTDINADITRKYTDIVVVGGKLYSLPFGETKGLTEIVEFDIDTEQFSYYTIPGRDFAKKYNAFVQVGSKLIGLPYGGEYNSESDLGIVFDTETKEIIQFSIGIDHGGKYRYRTGVEYKGSAFFFPGGSPSCPVIKVSDTGEVLKKLHIENTMLGRAVVFRDKLWVMCYDVITQRQYVISLDEELNYTTVFELE